MSPRIVVRSLSIILIVAACAGQAAADAASLAARVPPGANSIAVINVESMLHSPIGVKEEWRTKLSDAYASKPLVVPPEAQQVVLASWIDPAGLEPLWEVGLIQLTKAVSMERIARDEGGFVESLGGKKAAWTPMNAYFLQLDAKLLGVVSPAHRQFAAHWAAGSGPGTLSPYLREAVKGLSPTTAYLFALDLNEAVSEKRVRRRLDMNEFACLEGKDVDADPLCQVVASAKGLKLTAEVDDAIAGTCVIEFRHPTSALDPLAKPLLLEILDKSGAAIPDFAYWKVTAKDTEIRATGPLSTDGLRRLCSIVDPPTPANTEEPPETTAATNRKPSGGTTPPAASDVAAASQKYYQAVAKIIDSLETKVRTASSLTTGASYLSRDARRIGRLPILNVDPDLVDWGGNVSSHMIEAAAAFGVGGHHARARTQSNLNPYVNDDTSYSARDEIRRDPNNEVNSRNAMRLRLAAAAEEKAKVVQQVSGILQEIQASQSEIRAAMTQKYKVEF